MKRVVGLIAFCSMMLNMSVVANLEAKPSNVRTEKKIKRSPKAKVRDQKSKTVNKNKKSKKIQKKRKKSQAVSNSSETNKEENLAIIDEPVIDGSKINESSLIVAKNIKLAINTESPKFKKETNTPDVSSNDKEGVLAQGDYNNQEDTRLVANLEKSEEIIKEKMQQINNNRKVYDLIRPPKQPQKCNIQVSKFREELEHYRKIYSSKLKKA